MVDWIGAVVRVSATLARRISIPEKLLGYTVFVSVYMDMEVSCLNVWCNNSSG